MLPDDLVSCKIRCQALSNPLLENFLAEVPGTSAAKDI